MTSRNAHHSDLQVEHLILLNWGPQFISSLRDFSPVFFSHFIHVETSQKGIWDPIKVS